jgi:hypothetical protein
MEALEQRLDVQEAIATPFDDFDLVLEPFDNAACLSIKKVMGSFVHSWLSWCSKRVEAAPWTVSHTSSPVCALRLRSTFASTLLTNPREGLPQLIGHVHTRRLHHKPGAEGWVLVWAMVFSLPQRPHHTLAVLRCCFRPCSLQPVECWRAQRIQTFARPLRHLQAIHDHLNPFAAHLLCGLNTSLRPSSTDRFDRLAKLPRHAGEPAFAWALCAIWSHAQEDSGIRKTPWGKRDDISLPFLSRYLL